MMALKCRSCGAPLYSSTCGYCGTSYSGTLTQKSPGSVIYDNWKGKTQMEVAKEGQAILERLGYYVRVFGSSHLGISIYNKIPSKATSGLLFKKERDDFKYEYVGSLYLKQFTKGNLELYFGGNWERFAEAKKLADLIAKEMQVSVEIKSSI